MTLLRSLAFQFFFWAWTLVASIVFLPLVIFPKPYIVQASRFWSLGVLAGLKTLCNTNYKVKGWENIPGTPVLFAIKHQSAWDTLMLPLILPRAVPVLKRELLLIPFYGWYARKYGAIGINRRKGIASLRFMLRKSSIFLNAGRSIVIFPEGTRVEPGRVGDFHSGVTALYSDLDVPVVPVALNSGRFWRRRKISRKPGCITISFLPPIQPGLERSTFDAVLKSVIAKEQKKLEPPG